MAHDVFISYSSRDKATADAACAKLEAGGIRCWIAPRDITPGFDWGSSIVDAISNTRVFVLVFSSNANSSGQIKREVERAVSRGIPIIPLRIEDVTPDGALEYFINTPHWLDAFNPPLEQHLNYLTDVIRRILDGSREETRPRPVPPPPVVAKSGRPRYALYSALVLGAALLYWVGSRLVLEPQLKTVIEPIPTPKMTEIVPAPPPKTTTPEQQPVQQSTPIETPRADGMDAPREKVPNPPKERAAPSQSLPTGDDLQSTVLAEADLQAIFEKKGCDGLWYDRNYIYWKNNYRFDTKKGQDVFGTSGSTKFPNFNGIESKNVDNIRAFEKQHGCP